MTDTLAAATETDERPLRAPIEWRKAGPILDVRFADRIIEQVVVPYNFDGIAEYPKGSGRTILEQVRPGAFNGVETRANRIKMNRDHDVTRICGRCVALHPSREEGLVAETRISRTLLGDETLELAADGCLEASVGMAVMPSWQEFTDRRSRRIIHKAFLDHIAMLANPAYEGGVPVLDVRQMAGSPMPITVEYADTPNLDEVLAWLNTEGR